MASVEDDSKETFYDALEQLPEQEEPEKKDGGVGVANHLASFVAAVLKDDAVDDVLKEMEEFQSKAALIEVTGEGGSPVYASGDIREGSLVRRGVMRAWDVEMTQIQDFPLANLLTAQIRLGGVPLLHERDSMEIAWANLNFLDNAVDNFFDEEDGFGLFGFAAPYSRSLDLIGARCGPFENFSRYSSTGTPNVTGHRAVNMTSLANDNPGMQMRMETVRFRLPEMQDCLEKFGISKKKRVTGQKRNNHEI